MELEGDVIASTVVEDPKTDSLAQIAGSGTELAVGSRPDRQSSTFTSRTISRMNRLPMWWSVNSGSLKLDEQVVNLEGDVQMQLLDIPLNVASEALEWQVDQQQVAINQPVENGSSRRKCGSLTPGRGG